MATIKPLKGKAWIRDRFTKSPESGSYLIPNEVSEWCLMDFYREARSAGFQVKQHLMPEFGIKGFIAVEAGHDPGRSSGPVSYELYFVGVATHGRKLDPDDVVVDQGEWQATIDEHSFHDGFIMVPDSKKKSFKMICYCKAAEGKSIVRRVNNYDPVAMDKAITALVDGLFETE
jgi:hypothetical protein